MKRNIQMFGESRSNSDSFDQYAAVNAVLTTDHPQSNDGKPVLVIDGCAYGPDDNLPSGTSANQGATGHMDNATIKMYIDWLNQSPVWAKWVYHVFGDIDKYLANRKG